MSEFWQTVGILGSAVWIPLACVFFVRAAKDSVRADLLRIVGSPLRRIFALTAVAAAVAYGGSKPEPTRYGIRYVVGSAAPEIEECEPGRVYGLRPPPVRSGCSFAGWACSNGRRYDGGCLVFDLAKPGETVTMTAIWE